MGEEMLRCQARNIILCAWDDIGEILYTYNISLYNDYLFCLFPECDMAEQAVVRPFYTYPEIFENAIFSEYTIRLPYLDMF